jgi:hypothetical protein
MRGNTSDQPICNPYSLTASDGVDLDASILRGPASYCNDSKTHDYNVEFCESPVLGIKATRNIYHGDEMLCCYGDTYW